MTALIEIERLTKRFGAFTAVDDVTFSVAKGEVVGFLGPNGAGKSTTMRMLAGFMTPTAGTASRPVAASTARCRSRHPTTARGPKRISPATSPTAN